MNDYNPSTIIFSNNFCKDFEKEWPRRRAPTMGYGLKKKLRNVQYKRCAKETKEGTEVMKPEIIRNQKDKDTK